MKRISLKKRQVLQAAKIAVGSCAAIYIADALHLESSASAGSIALLTLVTTKWETLKLSLWRLWTFALTVALAWVIFLHFPSQWLAYGVYIFLIVIICDLFGWRATLSVNAVIGTHFLTAGEFGPKFILNEFLLVLIGITIAVLLNLYHDTKSHKQEIIQNMRYAEMQLQMILGELADYLLKQEMTRNVWDDIRDLEHALKNFIVDASEYQNNTFPSHPQYYIEYFEMRLQQCGVLHNLHDEMKKIRQMPRQARIISYYIRYMKQYVIEINSPDKQIERLEGIFERMRREPLPKAREEFESRAILYHILMDLEDFLIFKRRFVEELSEHQIRRYWDREKE